MTAPQLVAHGAPSFGEVRLYRCALPKHAEAIGIVREDELTECERCDGRGERSGQSTWRGAVFDYDAECEDCLGLGKVIGYGLLGDNCAPIPAELIQD